MKAVICELAIGLLLTGCAARTPPEPVFVGQLLPRSGPDKEIGLQAQQAVALAVEELKQKEETIAGRPLAVLYPDTRGNDEALRAEAVRLLTVNKVAALLGGGNMAEAERLGRIAQQYNVPLVTPSELPTAALSPYVFSVGLAPAEQGKALARFASQDLKAVRVGLLCDNQPLSAAVAQGFIKEFRKGEATVDEWTYQKEDDLPGLASKALGANPGAVLLAGRPSALLKLRSELRGSKSALLFGGEDGALSALRAESDKEGPLYLATAFVIDDSLPRVKEFVKTYQDKYGQTPDLYAALAHDGFRVLVEGMRRAQSYTGAKVRDELAKLENFDSLTGPLSYAADQSVRRTVFVVRLEKGQVKLVQPYEPDGK